MLNRLNPFLCSAFLTDVVILTFAIYGYAGLFFPTNHQITLYFRKLTTTKCKATVCVIFFSKDRKKRGFKNFGRNIATGDYQGNCSIKVFEVNVMFVSNITSYVANNSSWRPRGRVGKVAVFQHS